MQPQEDIQNQPYIYSLFNFFKNASFNVFSRLTYPFVGDLFTGQLTVSNRNFSIKRMGLLGNVYIIKSDGYQIAQCLNQLDKLPDGRHGYEMSNILCSSKSHILASNSNEISNLYRKLIKNFLSKQNEIIKLCIEETQKTFTNIKTEEININFVIRGTLQNIFAKVFFDMDYLPPETNQFFKNFSEALFDPNNRLFPALSSLLNPSVRRTTAQYENFRKFFLDGQIDKILNILAHYELEENRKKNIVATTIVELVKIGLPEKISNEELCGYLKTLSKEQVVGYFNHDLIKTLPSLFILIDNVSESLTYFFRLCSDCQNYLKEFQIEWQEHKLSLNNLSIQDLKKLKNLEISFNLLLTALSTAALRYTSRPFILKSASENTQDLSIDANSLILFKFSHMAKEAIKNGSKNNQSSFASSRSIVFSPQAHIRTCPGSNAAQQMFAAIASTVINTVDIRHSEQEDFIKVSPIGTFNIALKNK